MKPGLKKIAVRMLQVAAAGMLVASCDDTMDAYRPDQYFSLPEHTLYIGLKSQFKVTATCSSVWKLTTREDWISFPREYGNTGDSLLVRVVRNRNEVERTGYIYVETFFKDDCRKDSIAVIQDVDFSPEITPEKPEFTFGAEAGNYALPIAYNNSVKVDVTSNSPWLTLKQNELPGSGNRVHTEDLTVSLTENRGVLRTAILKLTSSGEGNPSIELKVMQKGKFIPRPAIVGFYDEFDECTVKNSPFVSDKWMTACHPEFNLFKCLYFDEAHRYPLIYNPNLDGLTGYMIMTDPFNVKAMRNKVMTYIWNRGNLRKHEDGRFEVVASVDYAGDIWSATWEVVKDVTLAADDNSGMGHPNRKQEVALDAYSDVESVYLGFRYTGKGGAYRIDNLKVGD